MNPRLTLVTLACEMHLTLHPGILRFGLNTKANGRVVAEYNFVSVTSVALVGNCHVEIQKQNVLGPGTPSSESHPFLVWGSFFHITGTDGHQEG